MDSLIRSRVLVLLLTIVVHLREAQANEDSDGYFSSDMMGKQLVLGIEGNVGQVASSTITINVSTNTSAAADESRQSASPIFISSIISTVETHLTTTSATFLPSKTLEYTLINIALNQTFTAILDYQTNAIDLANNLSRYFQLSANPNASLRTAHLSPAMIHHAITRLNVTYNITSSTSFIMSKVFSKKDNDTVVGGAFYTKSGGLPVLNTTQSSTINANISAAVIFSSKSVVDVAILRVLIIDMPADYRRVNDSNNKTLASSVVVTNLTTNSGSPPQISVHLYFTVQPAYAPNVSADYYCSFFDTNNGGWNETGCSPAKYDPKYQRYSCTCNHSTSFGLVWLPRNIPLNLTTQDIASDILQCISMACFLAILIHSVFTRVFNSSMSTRAYDLLPLISCAATMLLFAFYIALGMTVYTRTESTNQTVCFQSASTLMFFVYFFIIFMFCAKTSVGYFNYLRFVYLFPEPSLRQLYALLIGSFFISITCVAFAAGFDSNPSFEITQLYPYKLCWFTRRVIHYFLTIPVCIFLLLNIIMIAFVTKHIIDHVGNATSPHQSYERMKKCIIVLLSSCITQGVGWLLGPIISVSSPTVGGFLGWIFVGVNGLEGVWSILLYIIIKQQRMDEQKRVEAAKRVR